MTCLGSSGAPVTPQDPQRLILHTGLHEGRDLEHLMLQKGQARIRKTHLNLTFSRSRSGSKPLQPKVLREIWFCPVVSTPQGDLS